MVFEAVLYCGSKATWKQKQFVLYNGATSSMKLVKCGVP